VKNAVTQGIIQGESVGQIGKRLSEELSTSNARKMDMFARTAVTGAQNAGRVERMRESVSMGIDVKKKWLATLDKKTRDTHRDLDGKEQDVDKPFLIEGKKIDYPGDPKAPAELVYNCRCTLTYSYPKYKSMQDAGKRRDQETGAVIPNTTYREWEAMKKGKQNQEKAQKKRP
jgi:SPP1 gp7 family putative phage head morphogenesis protein